MLSQRIEAAVAQFRDFQPSDVSLKGPSPEELCPYIDHTLLKPDATSAEINQLCQDAITYGFTTVCVNSSWIPFCVSAFAERTTTTIPIAVVGFPLGAGIRGSKSYEAKLAIQAGAKEIDMVLHIGKLKEHEYDYVFEDIMDVYETCGRIPLKVILETSMLSRSEIIAACVICKEIGVSFVKTSTGFGGGGARSDDVALMKAVVGENIQVKASGGIRTYEDAVRMYNAGARRIGASSSIAIVTKRQ